MSGLSIRRAEPADAALVAGILMDCAAWLKSKAIQQWDFELQPQAEAVVARRLEQGEVYLGFDEGLAVGTLTLQGQDNFWGLLGMDPRSMYLHSVAVLRSHAGQGRGRELILWAEQYGLSLGRERLCLDCYSSNARLLRYYQDLGYRAESSQIWNGRALSFMAKDLDHA
jgi:GNAT superfamily N-acetyltransferase